MGPGMLEFHTAGLTGSITRGVEKSPWPLSEKLATWAPLARLQRARWSLLILRFRGRQLDLESASHLDAFSERHRALHAVHQPLDD